MSEFPPRCSRSERRRDDPGVDHAERRQGILLWVAAPLLTLIVALVSLNVDLVGSWDDDAIYLATARSLAAGDGPRADVLPGDGADHRRGPLVTKYPPLYPLLLAGLIRAGWNIATMQGLWRLLGLHALLYAGTVTLWINILLPRLGCSVGQRWAALLLLAVNAPLLRVMIAPLSENLFLLLLTLELLAMLWLLRPPEQRHGSRLAGAVALALGVTGGLATITRTVGLVIGGACVAVLSVRRRWVGAALLLGCLVLMLAVIAAVKAPDRSAPAPASRATVSDYYVGYGAHTAFYTDALRNDGIGTAVSRVMQVARFNTAVGLQSLKELFYPRQFAGGESAGSAAAGRPLVEMWEKLLGALLLAAAAFGLAVQPPARPLLPVLAIYVLVFVFWTWPFSIRFWTPLFPLLVVGLTMCAWYFRRAGRLVLWCLVASSVLVHAVLLYHDYTGRHAPVAAVAADDDAYAAAFDKYLHWLRRQTSSQRGDVLLSGFETQWVLRRVHLRGQWLDTMLDRDTFFARMLAVEPEASAGPAVLADQLLPRLATLRRLMPPDARLLIAQTASVSSDLGSALRLLERNGDIRAVTRWQEDGITIYEMPSADPDTATLQQTPE